MISTGVLNQLEWSPCSIDRYQMRTRRKGGSKKSEHFADVICVWSLPDDVAEGHDPVRDHAEELDEEDEGEPGGRFNTKTLD